MQTCGSRPPILNQVGGFIMGSEALFERADGRRPSRLHVAIVTALREGGKTLGLILGQVLGHELVAPDGDVVDRQKSLLLPESQKSAERDHQEESVARSRHDTFHVADPIAACAMHGHAGES